MSNKENIVPNVPLNHAVSQSDSDSESEALENVREILDFLNLSDFITSEQTINEKPIDTKTLQEHKIEKVIMKVFIGTALQSLKHSHLE